MKTLFAFTARAAGVLLALGFATLTADAAVRYLLQRDQLTLPNGAVAQGDSVALSADGSTAIIGKSSEADGNGVVGEAYVFVRNGATWTFQQKLVGSDWTNQPTYVVGQGKSVALSADGNTAIIGGPGDNNSTGAAWIFTRSGGVWTQQNTKLVAIDAAGPARQGTSVALSADGNTAVIGGEYDNQNVGAVWMWGRSGGTWTRLRKLVGSGSITCCFRSGQGHSVAISADASTVITGSTDDNEFKGAVWVWVRNGNTFAQLPKMTPSSGTSPRFGTAVALSGDGSVAVIGAPGWRPSGAQNQPGIVWVRKRTSATTYSSEQALYIDDGYQRGASVSISQDASTVLSGGADGITAHIYNGTQWSSPQGPKMTKTQSSVGQALSADGSTVMVGGVVNVNVQTYVRQAPHDFSLDGRSDIAWWQTGTGATAVWLLNGAAATGSGAFGNITPTTWRIVGQADFNGDGKADWLWRDSASGSTVIWFLDGTSVISVGQVGTVPPSWSVAGTGDLNNDGKADLLWRDASGNTAVWLMNGAAVTATGSFGVIPTSYTIVGHADFSGDGIADILWRDTSGNMSIWFMNGTSFLFSAALGNVGGSWSVVSTADFNGDGHADLLWRDGSGNTAIWLMFGQSVLGSASLGTVAGGWTVAQTGDYNGDGKSDILWRNTTTGDTTIWFMNGTTFVSGVPVANVATTWTIPGANAN